MERLREHAHQELVLAGGRPRRTRVTGPQSLTAAQQQVARIAADRPNNRQIAEELFVTIKTVETHLAAVYRKLGITTRDELAAPSAPPADLSAAVSARCALDEVRPWGGPWTDADDRGRSGRGWSTWRTRTGSRRATRSTSAFAEGAPLDEVTRFLRVRPAPRRREADTLQSSCTTHFDDPKRKAPGQPVAPRLANRGVAPPPHVVGGPERALDPVAMSATTRT